MQQVLSGQLTDLNPSAEFVTINCVTFSKSVNLKAPS